MNPTAPSTSRPAPPDPTQDRIGSTMPERIAALLHLVRILLGHGRRLAETVTARADSPQFATVAAVVGTYDLPLILARVKRGIMRLVALEIYLLARALKRRDIVVVPPRTRIPATPVEIQEPALPPEPRKRRIQYDPDSAHIPTFTELDREVRRTPFGRTIARVCMDLAVIPGFCTGEVWNDILDTLQCYGGSLGRLYAVRGKREKIFKRERDKRPETWDWDWRDLQKPTIRQVLGWLIGEAPTLDPPDPDLAPA